MAPFFILDTDKLNSTNRLRVSARHNLREIASEIYEGGSIDPKRVDLNSIVVGPTTAQGVMTLHKQLLAGAEIGRIKKDGTRSKMRGDAVVAIEFMVSIPTGVVEDEEQFFAEVPAWIERRYGVPVLSAVIHRDEAKPHVHCLVLPVKNGRMVGSDLIGRYENMHADFHRQVAAKHGLARKMRLASATRKAAAPVVMAALDAEPTLMQTPQFHTWLQGAVERNPEVLMELIGLPMDRPPAKEWIEIMTQPVSAKQEKPYVGFVAVSAYQSDENQSFTCVRDRSLAQTHEALADVAAGLPESIIIEPAADADIGKLPECIVFRDADIPAACWNSEVGEYFLPSPPPPSARDQAMSDIRAILRMREHHQEDSVLQSTKFIDP